jgi:hypothetical protein
MPGVRSRKNRTFRQPLPGQVSPGSLSLPNLRMSQLRIAGKESQAMLLWYDTAPRRVEVDCKGCTSVRIWNVWDTGDGTVHSWHHGAAMIVEPAGHRSWLFRCNDGRPDDACDDLVFRVHLLPSLPTE